MANHDFKPKLEQILSDNPEILLSDLVEKALEGIKEEDKGRANSRLLSDLSAFEVWGMITREVLVDEEDQRITLTRSGTEQIRQLRELRRTG